MENHSSSLEDRLRINQKPTNAIIDPDSDDEESYEYCGICQSMSPRYRCPRCNVQYCSLKCYKDEKHAECTENFYKALVLDEVNSNRPLPSDNNQAFLQRLRALEQDDDGFLGEDDDEEDDDDAETDLERRFAGLDVENADVQALWSRLSPEEQQNFMQLVSSDDSKLPEIVGKYDPWWETPMQLVNEVDAPTHPAHVPPLPKELPDFKRMSQHSPSLPLLLNLLHSVMVYTHMQRHTLGGLHDSDLLQDNIEYFGKLSGDILCSNTRQFVFHNLKDVAVHFASCAETLDRGGSHPYTMGMQLIKEAMSIFEQPMYLKAAMADLFAFTVTASKAPVRNKSMRNSRIRRMHKVNFYLAAAQEISDPWKYEYNGLKQEIRDDAAVSMQYLADELSSMGKLQEAAKYYRQNMP
ncbi:hypothetical protein INT44_005501 [Umbelopsis vinacea]|uniref:HIT-type domain-containing protein n=1 Tax=Umbelopsis vinacea TaxID=44442 RepID=A0A8H7Q8L3_9FUNG|nr:hypothetical protein INT44_005501 [Umbelopsis vinacea]